MKVEIYSKSHCPFCEKAKKWFQDRGYEYTEYKLDNDEERMAFYQRVPSARSVPQIFIDDVGIGGSDDLAELDQAGKLDAMLAGA